MLATLLALAGCAAGKTTEPSDEEPEAEATSEIDVASELDDGSDAAVEPDAEVLDLDSAEGADELPVCTPNTASCLDANTVERCTAAGVLEQLDCVAPQFCENGACRLPDPICVPNRVACSAWNEVTSCSADGLNESTQDCLGGRCLDGVCRTGEGTGAGCGSAAQCAGQSCTCAGACQGTPLEGGYCTTLDCDRNVCAPGELCVDFGIGELAGQRACVLGCGSCARIGFGCRELPTVEGAAARWEEGCWMADYPRDVGAPCTAHADCLGGLCLQNAPSGTTIDEGYCSAPCANDLGCPTKARCVSFAGYREGQGLCVLRCVGNDCPPERPNSFDIYCFSAAPVPPGAAVKVCFQN